MEYMKTLSQKCLTYLGQDIGPKAIKFGKKMELRVIQLTSGRNELVIDPIKVGIVTGVFLLCAVMSFFVEMGGVLLDICGTILIVYAPLAVYQTVLLKRYQSVRDYLNLLRRNVNRFRELNKDLEIKQKKLRIKVDEVRKINDRFSELTIAEKGDVEELTSVIEELKEINRKMKKVAKSEIVNSLVSATLLSDDDGDFYIGHTEFEKLILSFKQRNTGWRFKERKFRNYIGKYDEEKGVHVEQIMKLIHHIYNNDTKYKDRIFTFDQYNSLKASRVYLSSMRLSSTTAHAMDLDKLRPSSNLSSQKSNKKVTKTSVSAKTKVLPSSSKRRWKVWELFKRKETKKKRA